MELQTNEADELKPYFAADARLLCTKHDDIYYIV